MTVDVPGGPTGVVYNGGSGFVVGHGAQTGPARFLYACEDGTIRAWSPNVPHGFTNTGEGELRLTAIHGAGRFTTEWLRGPDSVWSSKPDE